MRVAMPDGISVADVQALMAQLGFYAGAIDGDVGPHTWAAVSAVERWDAKRAGWPAVRRLVGAAQAVLDGLGHEPGAVDGWFGHNTREALTAWRSAAAGVDPTVVRVPRHDARSHPAQLKFPRQADLVKFYGQPGSPACTRGRVVLPIPFRIAWDLESTVSTFACHERCADALNRIFAAAVRHYGENFFRALGLDLYGGCYNYRRMRAGSAMSLHAFGAAVDLDPARNQLRWRSDRAQFAKPQYEPFWQIVMEHGFTPAGYAWGADWMHLQGARL